MYAINNKKKGIAKFVYAMSKKIKILPGLILFQHLFQQLNFQEIYKNDDFHFEIIDLFLIQWKNK